MGTIVLALIGIGLILVGVFLAPGGSVSTTTGFYVNAQCGLIAFGIAMLIAAFAKERR